MGPQKLFVSNSSNALSLVQNILFCLQRYLKITFGSQCDLTSWWLDGYICDVTYVTVTKSDLTKMKKYICFTMNNNFKRVLVHYLSFEEVHVLVPYWLHFVHRSDVITLICSDVTVPCLLCG